MRFHPVATAPPFFAGVGAFFIEPPKLDMDFTGAADFVDMRLGRVSGLGDVGFLGFFRGAGWVWRFSRGVVETPHCWAQRLKLIVASWTHG